MKVWLIREPSDPYEPWAVVGIFSSKEKAEEHLKTCKLDEDWCRIEEWEIDSSNHPEIVFDSRGD